jgi:hypothetical protein
MLKMGSRLSNVARVAQITAPHSLADGSFNSGSRRILLLPLCCFLTLSCLLEGLELDPWSKSELASFAG